ncbi:MAG: hypothetical protein R3B84_17080 [Zavarzinella sp.]
MLHNSLLQARSRRGTITVIVVVFIALFFVVGLTFLLSSQNYSESAKIHREAAYGGHTGVRPTSRLGAGDEAPPNPGDIFNTALGYVVYDAPNDASGVYVGIRGHSLARAMYGMKMTDPSTIDPNAGLTPYAGIGRNRTSPDFNMINYTWDGNTTTPTLRDPEYPGTARLSPAAPMTGQYWPHNPNYTYPDENNVYLAAIDWLTGQVIMPSYHRPWMFGAPTQADPWALNPGNLNWTNAQGRLSILRPRPQEHPRFPLPQASVVNGVTYYGDVENLENKAIGRQLDSLWMDLDLPVRTWRGKKYKPLVAFLIADLDGRINLNTSANMRYASSGSTVVGMNQGWGPWEVDMSAVLGRGTATSGDSGQVSLLLRGNTSSTVSGRYGYITPTTDPTGGPNQKNYTTYADDSTVPSPSSGSLPHFYAPVDFDGVPLSQNVAATKWAPPASAAGRFDQFAIWGPPQSGPGTYDPNNRYHNGTGNERVRHPSLYNPYLSSKLGRTDAFPTIMRSFGAQELYFLNRRFQELDPDFYNQSDVATLALNSFAGSMSTGATSFTAGLHPWTFENDTFGNPRFYTTTISNDLQRPGGTPWYARSLPPDYSLPAGQPFPVAPPRPFDFSATGGTQRDWNNNLQSWVSMLGTVDLYRPLTDFRTDRNLPYTQTNLNAGQYARALADRIRLVDDVYIALIAATGMRQPVDVLSANNTDEVNALRYLAQIAVNIVDYIDNDDYITPYQWARDIRVPNPTFALADPADTSTYVFGTELNRLVINETYIYLRNHNYPGSVPPDPDNGVVNPPKGRPSFASRAHDVKVWVELHNPLTPQNQFELGHLSDGGNAILNDGNQDVYQIVLMRPDGGAAVTIDESLRDLNNSTGRPTSVMARIQDPGNPASSGVAQDIPYDPTTSTNYFRNPGNTPVMVPPNIGSPVSGNAFFIAGPDDNLGDASGLAADAKCDNLLYRVSNTTTNTAAIAANRDYPIIVLRRLMNQHLPFNPATNPYITVDYVMTDPGMVNRRITHDNMGPVNGGNPATPWEQTFSFGRRQPYDARLEFNDSFRQRPATLNGMAAPLMDWANNTFRRHNLEDPADPTTTQTLKYPFDWCVHLDRVPASPAELVHVSAVSPTLLTHNYFQVPAAPPYPVRWNYQAPWFDNGTRLYRAMDLFAPPSRIHGVGDGGRVPGKININTVYNKRIFEAATGRRLSNNSGTSAANRGGFRYDAAAVDVAWARLNQNRWGGNPLKFVQGQDRPIFGSMSPIAAPSTDAQYPQGMGVDRTIFGGHFYDPAAPDSYAKYEMLQTIMNNFTTRSNTFAVWATVGYFEVENDGPYSDANRPRLGRELGIDDGSNVRHKFFSIVDRTRLTRTTTNTSVASPSSANFSFEPVAFNGNPVLAAGPEPDGPGTYTLAIPAMGLNGTSLYGEYDNQPWQLQIGSRVMVDYEPQFGFIDGTFSTITGRNPKSETAVVQSVNYNATAGRGEITVQLNQTHHRGCSIIIQRVIPAGDEVIPGNPGPQKNFNYSSPTYRPVVPVVEQIK